MQRPPLAIPLSVPLEPPHDLAEQLQGIGVTLDVDALGSMGRYLGLLLAMNEQMNLTAIREPSEAWRKHALDALTLVPLVASLPAGAGVIDIGSGGGLPAIPLAIARPDLRVTLVEATQKKASFLSEVARELGLRNVSVLADRAEQLAMGALRGSFDAVTARAVARLALLVPITAPFAKPGGWVLLIKGQRAQEELMEATKVLKKQRCTHEQTVPTPTGQIVVLKQS